MTHILITSGGTAVAIDPVRYIGNHSSGHFGSLLARAALETGMQVTYLCAMRALTPFHMDIDCNATPNLDIQLQMIKSQYANYEKYNQHYQQYDFFTFDDYAKQLKQLVTQHQPNIIMLAAAVSDYLVGNYSVNKVRSHEALQIELKPAPKIIHSVREWSPASLIVGFKLLVNANDQQLIEAAQTSIKQHDLDYCIANDLTSMRRSAHEVIMVARDGSHQKITTSLAATIIAELNKKVKS